MNNLSLAASSTDESAKNTIEKSKPKTRRKSKQDMEEVRAVRIFKNTVSKIDELIEESKKNGVSRIQARHLVKYGISKITMNDLEALRKETATTEDKFEDRLGVFQKTNPKATRESFLEHLLSQSKSTN